MEDLTLLQVIVNNLNVIIDFLGCLIFSFLGSLFKEIYNTNNIKKYEFAPYKVICSTVVGSIASSVFRAHYFSDATYAENALITFIFGLLGFEIFKDLTSVEGIKRLIGKIKEITGILFGGNSLDKPKGDKDDKNTENDSDSDNRPKNFHGSIRGIPVTPKINIHKKDDE